MQKLGIFKASRSHSSLLSSQSSQQQPDQRQREREREREEHEEQQRRRGSYQASIESPVQSPASPSSLSAGPARSVSPLVPVYHDKNSTPPRPILAAVKEPDISSNPVQKPKTLRKLRRSQSQRNQRLTSPPSDPTGVNLVGPTTQANRPSPQIDENPSTFHHSQQEAGRQVPEQKKKRRFFGRSDNSSLNRRLSTKGESAPRPRIVTTTSPQQQNWSPSANYPSPTVDEESEEEIVTKNLYRHSVAFTGHTLYTDHSPSTAYSPSVQDSPSSQFNYASFNTASSQSQPQEQGGSHKAPAWERIGRSGQHHRNHSSDQQYPTIQTSQSNISSSSVHKLKPELSFPDASHSSSSRPPSRQSLEPPSPSITLQGPFHHRGPSVQSTASLAESQMGPSNNQQHSSARSHESTQQGAQLGSAREGNQLLFVFVG